MARIRTIKPEFFTSEDIVELSPFARLLYIALWCEADRDGRMQWKPRTFKMRYFPADTIDINALCDELLGAGLVCQYGDGLAYIPKFALHQHINPRESHSSLPAPDQCGTVHDESPPEHDEMPCETDASSRVSDASAREEAPSVTHREERKGKESKHTRRSTRLSIPQLADVPDALLADWTKLRNRKSLPITQTAVDGIEREAKKAGLSMAEALRMCCERGWGGFSASWINEKDGKAPATSSSIFAGVE